jgi:hypothetical protein
MVCNVLMRHAKCIIVAKVKKKNHPNKLFTAKIVGETFGCLSENK